MASRRTFLEALGAAGLAAYGAALARPQQGDRLAVYPGIERDLRRNADERARTLARSGLELRAEHGSLASSLDIADIVRPAADTVQVPRDGLLVFAIDIAETGWVEGTLELRPDRDARPGLRVTVLSDTTIVGAPMTSAAPWGIREITDPAPVVDGVMPSSLVPLGPWLMPKGRRYLTIAGPHTRAAGTFASLRLRVLDQPQGVPLAGRPHAEQDCV